MPPRTKSARDAGVDINGQYVGIFRAELFWRRRSRCAEDDLEASRAQRLNRTVHPLPSEFALAFLDAPLGKFTDAHIGQAPRCILSPFLLRPVFWIIADAKHGDCVTGQIIKGKPAVVRLVLRVGSLILRLTKLEN